MLHVRALLLILAAGCYTQPVYSLTPHEQCAQNAMVLDGGDNGGGLYGASSAVAPGENGGLYGASSRQAPGESGGLYGASMRSDGQDVRCRRPATTAEQCQIRSMQASAQLKHQSNAGEVAPVSNDQVEYVRSSTYQNCMAGSVSGPPGAQ
jgi:hypothetical protein